VALILILHGDPEARRRIRLALECDAASHAHHRVSWLERWPELRERATGTDVVAVVDAYLGGTFAPDEVKALLLAIPGLPLVVYSDFSHRPASDCLALFEAGVRLTLTLGVDDQPHHIRSLIARADGGRVLNPTTALLRASRLPRRTIRVLDFLFRESHRRLCPADLASHCGCSVRTLERYLGDAGLPAPGTLIGWCRILHAARLLDDTGRSLENAAAALGFCGGAALRKSLRRLTGLTPSELRRLGGAAYLAELFFTKVLDSGAAVAVPRGTMPPPTPAEGGLPTGKAALPESLSRSDSLMSRLDLCHAPAGAHSKLRILPLPLAMRSAGHERPTVQRWGGPTRRRGSREPAPSIAHREGMMRLTVTSIAEHRSAQRYDLGPGAAGGPLGLVAPGASTTCASSCCCSCCTAAITAVTRS
jgi:AraC-like DNA-binding protein